MCNNYKFLTIGALFFGLSLNAQSTDNHEHHFSCGTHNVGLEEFQKTNAILSKFKLDGYRMPTLTYIPIKMHLIGEDDGTGHASENDVNDMLADLNKNFKDNNIQFYFAGTSFNKYNDSKNNYNNDTTGKLDSDFHNANGVNNAINFYVLKYVRGVGGYAYLVPWKQEINRMYVITGQINDKKSSPHEMGHLFGLNHTFQDANNSDISKRELVTRNFSETSPRLSANCDKTGDYLCDTEADPYGRADYTVTNCMVNDITDANNDQFTPNMGNIMNYLWCPDYNFTPQQREKMTTGALTILNNTTNDFDYNAPETEQPAPSNVKIEIDASGYNRATITWDDNSSLETGYIIEIAENGTNDFTAVGGVKANETSYALTNFDNSKNYVFRIKPSNTKATYSEVSAPVKLPTYCTNPYSHQCSASDEADTIINSISVSKGGSKIFENKDSGCSPEGIANYFDTKKIIAKDGEELTFTISVKPKVTLNNGYYYFNWIQCHTKAFCDWNNDGDFDDENELLFFNQSGALNMDSKFTIPQNTKKGVYRLRFVLSSTNIPITACSAQNGEIEDYALEVDSTMGIENTTKNSEINLYPNPASDLLYINNTKDITSYTIIDASGRVVKTGNITETIDIRQLENGVYILSLSHKNGNSINKRFIKNK